MTRARSFASFAAIAIAFVLVAFSPLLVAGCRSCSRSQHLAEVTQPRGDVTRDTADALRDWKPAAEGAKLSLGDGVKTGAGSGALVRLASGGAISVASETVLRFAAGDAGRAKLAIEAGEASIEASDQALALETTIGLAHIEAGGRLRLQADGGTTRLLVTIGSARIDTEDGPVTLAPGKEFEVSFGGAIVEREVPDAAATGPADSGGPAPKALDSADGGSDAQAAGVIALDVRGAGVRLQREGAKTWHALSVGASPAAAGDTLDVPKGASVDVRRGTQAGRLVGQGRFVLGPPEEGALVRALSGRVEIEGSGEDVVLQVPGGSIVARSDGGQTRVASEITSRETVVTVRQGQGVVRGNGTPETVRTGESATLSPKGAVAVSGRGPSRADFSMPAGESIVVRDPKPPLALGFDFSSVCKGGAVVSRGRTTSRGDTRAVLLLSTGRHDYAVRCIGPDGVEDKPSASGVVTVIADAARAELPRLPPATVVDADGRKYTVLYQNLLPSVIARWQDAPAAKGYVLHLDAQRLPSDAARQSLAAGTVSEGTHTLWFETDDGAKRSPETTLAIKFDNAAPAASVREPADGSFKPGDTVKVAGVAVEGWSVAVNGEPVALDEQKRFSTTATVPSSEDAIVLRLSHPRRGIVYYVRHAAGTHKR